MVGEERGRERKRERVRDATTYCVPGGPVVVVTSHTLPLKNGCEIHCHNLPTAVINTIQTRGEGGGEEGGGRRRREEGREREGEGGRKREGEGGRKGGRRKEKRERERGGTTW